MGQSDFHLFYKIENHSDPFYFFTVTLSESDEPNQVNLQATSLLGACFT